MYGNKERKSCNQRVPMRYERDCDSYDYMMPRVKIIDECYNSNRCDDANYRGNGCTTQNNNNNRCDDANYRGNGYSTQNSNGYSAQSGNRYSTQNNNNSHSNNNQQFSSMDRGYAQSNYTDLSQQPMDSRDRYYNQNYDNTPKQAVDTRGYQSNQNAYSEAAPQKNNYNNYGQRATEMPDYTIYNQAPQAKAKSKMGTKKKVLIAVYAAIIVLIAVLVIVNCLPSANAQGGVADNGQQVQMGQGAADTVVDASGNVTNVVLVPSGNGYEYNTKTNWFDKFCDWLEGIVG